jgi:hypothetical protein
MPFFASYELMCVVGVLFIGMGYCSQNEGFGSRFGTQPAVIISTLIFVTLLPFLKLVRNLKLVLFLQGLSLLALGQVS